jgi:hypothetical protein
MVHTNPSALAAIEDAERGAVTPRSAVIPIRWVGHRLDVCAVVREGRLEWIARDILAAAELPLGAHEDEAGHDIAIPLAEHALATSWPFELAMEILATVADRPLVAELIRWLGVQQNELDRRGVETVAANATPAAADTAEETLPQTWWSVADAARVLNRDPAIDIGQKRLFDWMNTRGWISRPHNVWEPHRDLLQLGHLTVVPNRVRKQEQLYPQICITLQGLAAIHRHLGGTAELALAPVVPPALTED